MRADEVARRRLSALGLARRRFDSIEEVVRHLGAVQSQDYGPAGWSIGERLRTGRQRLSDQAAIDRAYADGRILRTHVLRTTWHFVLPDELRWLQQVTAPRVIAGSQPRLRQLGMTPELMARCHGLIAGALAGGGRMSRRQIASLLAAAGVAVDGAALAHVLMHAELGCLLCSGGLDGKQHTYALVDERVPAAAPLGDDDALAALTLRYFASHGPATAKDFQWWSSLTLAQVRRGLELVGSQLEQGELDELGGTPCWYVPGPVRRERSPAVHLLQGYDEYTVAYRQTKYVFDGADVLRTLPGGRPVYNLVMVLDGQLAGHWKRSLTGDEVVIEVLLHRPLDDAEHAALLAAAQAHGRHLGRSVTLSTRQG